MSYWEWLSGIGSWMPNAWPVLSAILAGLAIVVAVLALVHTIASGFVWRVKLPISLIIVACAFLIVTWLFWSGVVNA